MSTSKTCEWALPGCLSRLAAITSIAILSLACTSPATAGNAGKERAPAAAKADPATIAVAQALKARYPQTRFGDVKLTPVAGVWEVTMGSNVAYVTSDVRYFMFGVLYDMQAQQDLTSAKRQALQADSSTSKPASTFADLPLDLAIKTVRGNGRRKLAVFSDPDCPYCRDLEASLAKLDDVTVYTFLYPLEGIHPGATQRAASVWCAKDRSAAWAQMMSGQSDSSAPVTPCEAPISQIVDLAQRFGVLGTPALVFESGERANGALDVEGLEQRLASNSVKVNP